MNPQMLGTEFLVATGINSWGALKNKEVPWAGTMARCAVAFALIVVVGRLTSTRMAGLLGAGFLMASIMGQASDGWTGVFGATAPTDGTYTYLTIGSSGSTSEDN